MNIRLHAESFKPNKTIVLSGSKSETNRMFLLQALFPEIKIENISNSDDSLAMEKALKFPSDIVDVHHAGTAMRFLTAFFATQENREVVFTGSSRMQERPIHILVDALRSLGADIQYENKEGFPPLKIKGKKLQSNKIAIPANISSQYISALLLIAPKLENGLSLELIGEQTSLPYIKMTLALLNEIGIETTFVGNRIKVYPKQKVKTKTVTVESDWSSASYFFELIAFSEVGTSLKIQKLKSDSLQADRAVVEIFEQFGVETEFLPNNEIQITKVNTNYPTEIRLNLIECPDIAQTIAVTCFGLGIQAHLTGLHTLKIKETDRLVALKNELEKFGATVEITNDSLSLHKRNLQTLLPVNVLVKTYQDHRMAMAFAPLGLFTPIEIENAEVVSKSYPKYWEDVFSLFLS
ncbi:3-phosphoshikimate 1-carboxyvinyltransferase [Flavobacterium sp. I3-2]|uniref:3-phosphoshikimate 1-carboxyvinyltransferase n=1 Tax=Flavobacterium sp. I3-2 TaxID=2748319 RepID=UPI0015A7ADD8|nr:3-phosphoshikimate 1-carboxyvinyltransferase [Flavobacterium sp. I3-2]